MIQISTQENNNSKESSRSWFCVLNNPQSVFPDLEKPEDMVQAAIDKWCFNKPHRTCAINYEIGDTGTYIVPLRDKKVYYVDLISGNWDDAKVSYWYYSIDPIDNFSIISKITGE